MSVARDCESAASAPTASPCGQDTTDVPISESSPADLTRRCTPSPPPSHPPLPPSFISSFFSFFLLLFVPPSPFCLPLFPRHLPILPLFSSSSLIYSPLRCATSRSRGKVLWQPGSRSARRSTASSRSCCHFALARHSYPGMTSLRRWRLGSRGLRTARRCGSHLRISHAREHRRLNVERLLLLLFFFLPFSFFPFFFASLPSFTLRHILRTLTS